MNLYISDLHFGHANVIRFDHRPFKDVDEMDKCMIGYWNARVQKDDHVYVIGDFAYRNAKDAVWYLKQLRGHKHLIIGNHDGHWLRNQQAAEYFESIEQIGHVADGDKQIIMCHYPMAEWYKSNHGSWLIYGHIHGNRGTTFEFMKTQERALNAAACINNYMPCSFDELVQNNKVFQEEPELFGYEPSDEMKEDDD